MTQPIDTAYVDIVARNASMKKMERDIDRAMDRVERDVEGHLAEIDAEFDKTFDEIDKHFAKMEKSSRDSFDKMGDDADGAMSTIRRRLIVPLQSGLESLGDVATGVGRVIGNVASGIGGFAASSPLLTLLLVLAPAILAVAAALSNLIGLVALLPSGISLLVAAIIPLVVAFQGFGEAISAVMSGDLEKINEALAKLSPNAAAVAREFQKFLPVFRSFRIILQDQLFAPLIGQFQQFATVTLPIIGANVGGVVRQFGLLFQTMLNVFTSTRGAEMLSAIFGSLGRILERLNGPIGQLLDSFLSISVHALPVVEKLFDLLARGLSWFSRTMNESINDGSFDKFLDDALKTVQELFNLLSAVGGLIGTLFEGTEESGHTFIQALTDIITKLDEFFQSADGQAVIATLVFGVKSLIFAMKILFEAFTGGVRIIRGVLQFLNDIGEGFVNFVSTAIDWLSRIPGAIAEFIGSIPERVGTLLGQAWDFVLQRIGNVIGLIIFWFTQLPPRIFAFLESLPEKLFNLFVTVGLRIGEALNNAITNAKDIVVNGFFDIVQFIMSVPDRIRAMIPTFGSVGKSLIEGFMNGLRNVGSFIGDVAGDIVGAIKSFLNRAIDRINVGIAQVDDVLPGSLPRIPRLAQGAFIPRRPGGIVANIGEGSEDEWVLPQSKLDALTGQSIVFSPGAISINFYGALPTETEARAVGANVAQSIIETLSRQNLQTQVRAV